MSLAQELEGIKEFEQPAEDIESDPEYSDLEELSFSDGSEIGFTMAADFSDPEPDQPLTKLVLFDDEPLAKYLQNVDVQAKNISFETYLPPPEDEPKKEPEETKRCSFDLITFLFPYFYHSIPAPKAALHQLCFEYSYKEYGGIPNDIQDFELSTNLKSISFWCFTFLIAGAFYFYSRSSISFTFLISIGINLLTLFLRQYYGIQWLKAWKAASNLDEKILQFQSLAQRSLKKVKHMELLARGYGVSRAMDLPITRIEENDGISHVNELRRKLLQSLRTFCGEFSNASFILRGLKPQTDIDFNDVDFVPFLSELDSLLKQSFVRQRVFWTQTCKYIESSFHQTFLWQESKKNVYDDLARKIDDINLELFAYLNLLRKKRKRKLPPNPEPKTKRECFLRILRYLQERSDELTAGVQLVYQQFQDVGTDLELCYHCFERVGASIQRATSDWNNGQAYLYHIDKKLRKQLENAKVEPLQEDKLEDGLETTMNEDKQSVRVPNLNPEDMTEEMFELIAKKLEDDSDEESDNLHNPIPPVRINQKGLMQELRSVMGPKWKSKQVPDFVEDVEEESDSIDEETRRKIEDYHQRQTMNLAAMFKSMNMDLVRGNMEEFS